MSNKAHHYHDGKHWYVDSNFLNAIGGNLPGFHLSHMGFGEFYLDGGDKGRVDFDRMRGKNFEGQVGRSHQVYDKSNGKLVKKLISIMAKKGLSLEVKKAAEDVICDMDTLLERYQ